MMMFQGNPEGRWCLAWTYSLIQNRYLNQTIAAHWRALASLAATRVAARCWNQITTPQPIVVAGWGTTWQSSDQALAE
ncbi:hypothetical protein C7S18_13670 [Ahniella affigens]|uniref:Uncharacterized protein n=1 Tax=Ahniella affigens TaxID=2021234 RepID=A0A2P1PTK3_9GAMM|nr:hypothetical protein C7S18_13670 [Ahniella affigens]